MTSWPGQDLSASSGAVRRQRVRREWILVGVAVVLVLVQGWADSVPGGYFTPLLGVLLGWLALSVVWLIVVVISIVAGRRAHRPARDYWRLALVPALVLVAMAVGTFEPTRPIRFAIDRADLESYATKVRSGQIDAQHDRFPRRIGTLKVASVDNRDGCVLFEVDDAGFISLDGYAHCLTPPPDKDGYAYEHRRGSWYSWSFTD
jgi:hypothetical protein